MPVDAQGDGHQQREGDQMGRQPASGEVEATDEGREEQHQGCGVQPAVHHAEEAGQVGTVAAEDRQQDDHRAQPAPDRDDDGQDQREAEGDDVDGGVDTRPDRVGEGQTEEPDRTAQCGQESDHLPPVLDDDGWCGPVLADA